MPIAGTRFQLLRGGVRLVLEAGWGLDDARIVLIAQDLHELGRQFRPQCLVQVDKFIQIKCH